MKIDLRVRALGDSAVLIELGDDINLEVNRRVRGLAAHLEEALGSLAAEIVPAYAGLIVEYDPRRIGFDRIVAAAGGADLDGFKAASGRSVTLPVVYGGEHGPDLDDLAMLRELTPTEVIERHSGRDYPIFCMGFAPGFAFLGGLDPTLHTPRRETPRSTVPAGSVAIGGMQTGVYPTAMPGGWHLIGRTPLSLFNINTDPPIAYRPGDTIRFVPVDRDEYQRLSNKRVVAEMVVASQELGEKNPNA